MEVILVIGALGQLGSALVTKLRDQYPDKKILAADIRQTSERDRDFVYLDATDKTHIKEVFEHYQIKQVYHLAAILSAAGEKKPLPTWSLNMDLWLNVLEASRMYGVETVFFPSSIAVFGDQAPHEHTPQNTFLNPHTVYGISKAAGEQWGQYYYNTYGLDVRSLRYPGLIGYDAMPGGGTTDYAVDIFHKAVNHEVFDCFLRSDTVLPMMYMDDAIRAAIELMEAPKEKIKIRTSYNVTGISFSAEELVKEIRQLVPDFEVNYTPDYRQKIADTWPDSIDDSAAGSDWDWKSEYDLKKLVHQMIEGLQEKKMGASKVAL